MMKKMNFRALRSSSGRREDSGEGEEREDPHEYNGCDQPNPDPPTPKRKSNKSSFLKTIKRKLTLAKKKDACEGGACGGCEKEGQGASRGHSGGSASWRPTPRHVTKPLRPARSEEHLDSSSSSHSTRMLPAIEHRPSARASSARAARHSKQSSTEEDSSGSDRSKEVFAIDTEYGHASAPDHADHSPPHQSLAMATCNHGNAHCAVAAPTCAQQQLYENYEASIALSLQQTDTFNLGSLNVYDQVKDVPKIWSLTKELFKLSRFGWYWGPITRQEAEDKLSQQPDGAFLVRDSSDERYLLSLSFRSYGRTLHTRIEHCNGVFSFYAQPESEGYSSIVDLIKHSMSDSQTGVFCYSRARTPGSPSFPVRLTKPVSRFTQVRSLQYLCRFVIRQYTRFDHIQKLPLPTSIKGWLEENQY